MVTTFTSNMKFISLLSLVLDCVWVFFITTPHASLMENLKYCWWFRNPAWLDMVHIPSFFQGFIHVRWCRISSINSINSFHFKFIGFESPFRGASVLDATVLHFDKDDFINVSWCCAWYGLVDCKSTNHGCGNLMWEMLQKGLPDASEIWRFTSWG